MKFSRYCTWLLMVLALVAVPALRAGMSVAVLPSIDSPAPLGTVVVWTAYVDGASDGTLWYRFRVAEPGVSDFRMIRDYGPFNWQAWTEIDHESTYEIEVSVRNVNTGEVATSTALFALTPLATDSPAVTPTAHPLVFLYSIPPCASQGQRVWAQFGSGQGVTRTPIAPCRASLTTNFYLAGLRANTTYSVNNVIGNGPNYTFSAPISFSTSDAPLPNISYQVVQPLVGATDTPILLQSALTSGVLATDLSGNLLWYYPSNLSLLTRIEPGGLLLGIIQAFGQDSSHQMLRRV